MNNIWTPKPYINTPGDPSERAARSPIRVFSNKRDRIIQQAELYTNAKSYQTEI